MGLFDVLGTETISTVRAAAAFALFAIASSACAENLFTAIGPEGPPPEPHEMGAVTAWPVTVNIPYLATLPTRIEVALPNQLPITLMRNRTNRQSAEHFLWTGSGSGCSAVINVAPVGVLALFSCGDASYAVDAIPGSKELQLTSYDPSLLPEYDEGPNPVAPPQFDFAPTPIQNVSDSQDTTVDILVLYTEALEQSLGGKAKTMLRIETVIAQTQQAMDRSTAVGQPPIAEIRLVAMKKVDRVDGGTYQPDLEYMIGDAHVAALRKFWAADVVVLLRASPPAPFQCGLSKQPSSGGAPPPGADFAPLAASVLWIGCTIATYPFQHELGHIFGANHNPENNGNPTPIRPYAYGNWHADFESSYRTIMSMVSSNCKPSCWQVQNYSNPDVTTDDGFVTGTLTRNNAFVIAEFAPITAQYSRSVGRIFADAFED